MACRRDSAYSSRRSREDRSGKPPGNRSTLSGGASANIRYIDGARDGGAWRWQRYAVNDWTWSSADGWTLSHSFGEGSWRTNAFLGDSIDSINSPRSMYAAGVAVVMASRYEERYIDPVTQAYYYDQWCSPQIDLHLYPTVDNNEGSQGVC